MSDGRQTVAILGSTGSIGLQTLEVIRKHEERVRVVALAANSDWSKITEQASEFGVERVALADPEAADRAAAELPDGTVGSGPDAVETLAGDADIVLNALVGSAGLRATLAALRSGARLALANKESLVAGGSLVTDLAGPGQILPVDSEHSAIFQCLEGEPLDSVDRLWLTASGGPFRGCDRSRLESVSVDEALAHPTWSMGPKISIDSATMMNKGLEVIEAHHLFGIPFDRIAVAIHPRSCVHSMVEFVDGSIKAHLGVTDMRIPIQYALSYPERWPSPADSMDMASAPDLTFESPDAETFRALTLAYRAGETGGTMPAVMNAANEIGVETFLAGRCRFTDIDRVVEDVMDAHDAVPLSSVEQVEAVDAWARARARASLTDE